MSDYKEFPFVNYLEKLRDRKDRAALAKLRRGLGKKMGTPDMFPYVVPFLPSAATQSEQARYFLLASLFAFHSAKSIRGVTIGKAFKQMWNGSESVEKRFTNLLSADPDDIGGHLRHAVSLAKSRNTPIDYHQLFYDLKYWSHPDRFIQLAWARDFWGANRKNDTETQS
jgi:CRISPR system Cascade subunit CasB